MKWIFNKNDYLNINNVCLTKSHCNNQIKGNQAALKLLYVHYKYKNFIEKWVYIINIYI